MLSKEVTDRFVMAWNDIADEIHKTAQRKGWWDRSIRHGLCNARKPHVFMLAKDSDFDTNIKLECQNCGLQIFGRQAVQFLWERATERNKSEILALIHSEISEALEGLRKGDPANDQLPQYRYSEVELADALIRIADAAKAFGWNIGEALVDKMLFNEGREHRHGGKAF